MFLNKIIDYCMSIFGQSSLSNIKKRELRNIYKQIKKIVPLSVNINNYELTQDFGKIIFEIYQFTYSLKPLFNFKNNAGLKNSLIIYFYEHQLTNYQKECIAALSEEKLDKLFNENPTNESLSICS